MFFKRTVYNTGIIGTVVGCRQPKSQKWEFVWAFLGLSEGFRIDKYRVQIRGTVRPVRCCKGSRD
jgi:hypothetical protein